MKTTTPSATEVAQQFQAEALAPRTEIWSKDTEQRFPDNPSPECPTCPSGRN
ncbi:hypothetical protein GKZ68_20710 (plasmid) [Hymenobacter sp. BRD128]|uniref:hypothetical protein n=1 Tax=Hymenobacter sp. BRD128 TaxID=2675878 RepID=UPI0015646994|nr:hypothetical protein [Hymenobacter sp. BRD128]QKG59106.1 hypothetical protein GKZ68_20710 [Hymenobacter sp. BRD128]